MADHVSTDSSTLDNYPFEIYFKDLRISEPNPTKEDVQAAFTAAEDDPGVRQHHQPFALKAGEAGNQGRVTYIYVNGVFQGYHFAALKDGTDRDKIIDRLGMDNSNILGVGTADVIYNIDSEDIDKDLEYAEIVFAAKENVALCRQQVKIRRQLKEVEEEQRKLEEKRQSLKEEEKQNKEGHRQLREKLRKDGVSVYLGLAPMSDA